MALPIALDYRPALLSRAGIGRATRELARALAEDPSIELHLFAHSLARTRCAAHLAEQVHLHRLPIPGRSMPWLARLGLGADRLAGGVPVFHWTDYVQPPVTRATTVLTVHDLAFVRDATWHGKSAATLRERTLSAIGKAKVVIVPSQTTAADVAAFAPAATIRVVPFGADHAHRTQTPHALGGRPYALCLGTIEPRKNHRALLAAWRLLPEPRLRLVVVGDIGWECAEIVQDLRDAGAEGLIDWRRNVDDTLVFALLQHAALLVYPSLWEGFGFPPLEAMQLGVPVVANDVAPLRELGDGVFVFADARRPVALAEAIQQALCNAGERARMVRAGQTRAADFRWRDCALSHAAIYREVAAW